MLNLQAWELYFLSRSYSQFVNSVLIIDEFHDEFDSTLCTLESTVPNLLKFHSENATYEFSATCYRAYSTPKKFK